MSDPCDEFPPPLLMSGVEQFNRGEYFEQHETLEALWRAETRPVRDLYQGILQIGVAFHHVRRSNHHGAVYMLSRGVRYLQQFSPRCQGVDVAGLIRAAERALEAVNALGPRRLHEFDWSLAPRVLIEPSSRVMHVFYVHGFASSARSTKAAFLSERLACHGMSLQCPDLNEPDFSSLTVTRMIDQVEQRIAALPPGPVALVGSSLGGFVALHAAARQSGGTGASGGTRASRAVIDRLVLLAPALDFGGNRLRDLGDEGMERWRRTNALEVYHYGYGEVRVVHYRLFEDARQYDSFAVQVRIPTLIFQGVHDDAVDPEMVKRFARGRPNCALRLLEDGHQLLESLDTIWRDTSGFLGFTPA